MEITILIFIILIFILLIYLTIKSAKADPSVLLDSMRQLIQSELKESRSELSLSLKDNRMELSDGLERLTARLEEKMAVMNEAINKNARDNREDLSKSLKDFQVAFAQNVKDFNDLQRQKFDAMATRQDELVKSTEEKLEKMRETVDEKLHKTLEDRLGQSFKLVSERLEAVQKGLGEMQTLANGVGDLKRVLTNVKTRGILGEIQLGNILEQIMAPEQYEANVKTKVGSGDHVEYAIKLPGKDDSGKTVYLPIDAKFPQEDYLRLQAAFELGDKTAIDFETRKMVQAIKKSARDIRDKYIDPPNTTDFGILFLPVEGLYAEVVRQPELLAVLQNEFKVIVTGPTTLAAMLNSLQMGFRTLAIQKRSSEVWQVLGAVKTEFGKFGEVLEKARKKINEADRELDSLVGTRTRIMMSKLKNVTELPASESVGLLDVAADIADEGEDN
jgi:DNA recombination protein RmuC